MSIINNTSIGVGTTNPSYHLDVSGNSHVTGNSYTLGSVGVGTATPSYNLDVSENARFNGTIYNGSSILKQITSYSISSGFNVGTSYQNPYSTPIFVYMTLVTNVNANVFYNIYTGTTSSALTFFGNGVLVTQNQWINFIVLPYNYWMITGSPLSIASVVYYY